ncbi:hypothetical protein ABIB40_002903 [Pedobacter sp. UYP30]
MRDCLIDLKVLEKSKEMHANDIKIKEIYNRSNFQAKSLVSIHNSTKTENK